MSNTVTNQGKTIDQITSVDTISDASKKAYFIAQGVIPVSGPQGGETSATNKETLGVPVASISTDTSNKADKVVPAAAGNLATLNASGNLADSGSKVTDFATASQGTKADNAIQGVQLNGTTVTPDASKVVNILVDGGTKIRNSDSGVFDTIVLKGSGGVFVDPNTEEMQVGVDDTTIGLNTDDGELYVKNPVPAPAAAHADVGKVLTVKTVNDSDEIVWEPAQGGGSDLPSYTQSDAGKVLAVNQNGNGVEWINAGGGGDDADTLIVTIDVKDGPNYSHIFESATKSPWEAYQAYKNGKTVFANIRYLASNNEVYNVYSLPLSYLYYSDGILPVIYFVNYGVGSGSTSERIMLYNVEENDTWDNADSTFWS